MRSQNTPLKSGFQVIIQAFEWRYEVKNTFYVRFFFYLNMMLLKSSDIQDSLFLLLPQDQQIKDMPKLENKKSFKNLFHTSCVLVNFEINLSEIPFTNNKKLKCTIWWVLTNVQTCVITQPIQGDRISITAQNFPCAPLLSKLNHMVFYSFVYTFSCSA